MAKAKGAPISNPYVLTFVCIYETVRLTGMGPTFEEIRELLSSVYAINDLSKEELQRFINAQSMSLIEKEDGSERYYPLLNGYYFFTNLQDRIIPPQVVAQLERRRTP
jgi:hypothetical protein